MLQALLLAVTVAQVAPAPSASPLKTITTVKSAPLCTTLTTTVLYSIQGLQINDHIIEQSKPVLVSMGKAWMPNSLAGEKFDQLQAQWGNAPGGTHNVDNPGLILAGQQLYKISQGIVHNLQIIDNMLNDPARFPSDPKTDQDQEALKLKAQLQAVANQQRQNLNVLYGLADTFNMQDLIAHGDSTQGAINAGGSGGQVSHGDQDVSFQDPIYGPSRGRIGSPQDPTDDTDPAISQKAIGELANNPILRFYVGVEQNQVATAHAEDALTKTVLDVVQQCKK
ncbi:MAG TPA: hypothetical protein VMB20_15250 [Candidatus Acidoferrum sp.]|nr:hypothetical protein [Candidatus Acidoferrum sp.]